MRKTILTALCILAITAAHADAKKRHRPASIAPPVTLAEIDPLAACRVWCDPTPVHVEGSECSITWNECFVDEYGFPNCRGWWLTPSVCQ